MLLLFLFISSLASATEYNSIKLEITLPDNEVKTYVVPMLNSGKNSEIKTGLEFICFAGKKELSTGEKTIAGAYVLCMPPGDKFRSVETSIMCGGLGSLALREAHKKTKSPPDFSKMKRTVIVFNCEK